MVEYLSNVRMARTMSGWQVWLEGSQNVLAVTDTEREAKSIYNKLRRLGQALAIKGRLRLIVA